MKEIIWKVRKLLHTDLVRVSFYNGLGTFVKMLSGVISIKVVAFIVGPSGIALLGQLTNFTTIIQSIAGGGVTTGVTRYISEHAQDDKKVSTYIGTALFLTLILSVFTGSVLYFFAGYISLQLMHTIAFKLVFQIFGLSIFLYALNSLLMAILNGYKNFKHFVQINMIGSLISLLFSVILAVFWGLLGAMISVVTYQSIVFLIALYMLRKAGWGRLKDISFVYSGLVATHLFRYSFMALTSAIVVPLSQLIVRGYIVESISATDAGMWEGMNRISGMYLQVVISSLGVYYLPRLAELKTDLEFNQEVKQVFQVMFPFLAVAAFFLFVFRYWIISILFTSAFQPMESLFGYQLIGDLLKMSGWMLGYIMVAKAMVRTYIVTELVNYTSFVIMSILLTNWLGVEGAVIAYATGHAIYLLIMFWVFRKIMFYS